MGGFPAARITDTTAHGGKVVVGFPTVLINNLPASRIGDMHVCPMFTGPVPHVGGPFVLGAFNVIVGGVPQSRVTDMLICIGPPDVLAMGSPNVVVGMQGAMGMFGLVVGGLLSGLKTSSVATQNPIWRTAPSSRSTTARSPLQAQPSTRQRWSVT